MLKHKVCGSGSRSLQIVLYCKFGNNLMKNWCVIKVFAFFQRMAWERCFSPLSTPSPKSSNAHSVSYQLTGQKSNPIFSPIKIPYRTHSILNTISRLHRIMLWRIIPTKPINDAIITTSNILREINYQKPHQLSFRRRG